MDNNIINKKRSRQFPLRETPELISILLKDRTTKKNIIWASNNYIGIGKNFFPEASINEKLITNGVNSLVQPRIKKHLNLQKMRTKGNAEVFTPLCIVKKQNDLIEDEFKDLQIDDYIEKTWLEITCGEAPYMCTRYDAVSGVPIEIADRVGFLDRKLQRIASEINDHDDWLEYVYRAYQSSYGYEFQGDSLLIARENLFYTFIDYYLDNFKEIPDFQFMKKIATIISYNVFQMDGLKYTVPYSEIKRKRKKDIQISLFNDLYNKTNENDYIRNEIKVKIKDHKTNKLYDFEILSMGVSEMKFDVVIGNPPYQENDNGRRDDGAANASASPLYHLFVQEAEKISNIQSLIVPARWISGAGKGLSNFTQKMISENKIKYFNYYTDSKVIFPDNEIKGGVCYFLKDNNYNGKATIEVVTDKKIYKSFRFFDEKNIGVFIPYNNLIDILTKINLKEDLSSRNIQKIVSVRKPYGLSTDFFKDPSKYGLPQIQEIKVKDSDIEIFGLKEGKRKSYFVPRNYPIPSGENIIDKYKVFFSYAYGSGELGEIFPEPIIGLPNNICTETFLNIGEFNNFFEAESLLKYIKCKFFRALVGILKTTQHATKTFKFVPIQDFTLKSDIDWTKSIREIDQQLYKKYELSQEEIDFIESNVKEME